MKKTIKIILLFIAILLSFSFPLYSSQKKVIIGSYDYEPTIFKDKNGNIVGFYVDLITEIARLENWSIEFVYGTWSEGLDALKNKNIDLYMGVAHSDERDTYMDFTKEPIMVVWTETYTHKNAEINSLFDVENKTVGILDSDHNGYVFINYINKLNINCNIIKFNNVNDIFISLEDKYIDLAVIDNTAGSIFANKYNSKKINIIIEPFFVYCAVPENLNQDLLNIITKYLTAWKQNKQSVYYSAINHWLKNTVLVSSDIPTYFKYVGASLFGAVICFFTYILILKSLVKSKTYKLKENENFIKSVMDSLPIGVAVNSVNPTVKFSYMNNIFPEIYHTTRNELEKFDNFWDAVFEDDQYKQYISEKVINDCKSGDASKMYWENVEISRNNKIVGYVNARNMPFGGTDIMISTAIDVTDKVKAEVELAKHTRLLNETNKLAKVGGWTIKYDKTVEAPKNTYDIYELPYEFDTRLTIDFIKETFHNKEDYSAIDTFINNIFNKGLDAEIFCEILTYKQNKKWIHLIGSPVIKNNKVVEVFGATHDITELHAEQLEIERISKILMQSQKMEAIGNLAGGISHDFNNILAPILGYTEMLMYDIPEDSKYRKSLDGIYTSVIRAKELVEQILTFSRKGESKRKLIKIAPLIKETLKLLTASIPSSITIIDTIEESDCVVNADPTHINQIIMNLFTNAQHAIGENAGEIKLKLTGVLLDNCDIPNQSLVAGYYVCIIVKDTGKGIPPQILDKIFEPFFTTKNKGEGTGMGLSVVHGIVTNLDGFIKVYSELNRGTEFRIYIPAVDTIIQHNSQVIPNIPYETGTEHIMLIDDEELIVLMESDNLRRLGYKVTGFTNSEMALDEFKRHPTMYDLVISDIAMPNLTGNILAKEISKVNPNTPILLCTGFHETLKERNIERNGVKGILTKPVILRILSREIRKILDDSK